MSFASRLEYGVYQCGRFWMWVYLRVGHGLCTTGLEHVPEAGGCIIAGNHPSLYDPAGILVSCPRPVRFMAAEFLFNIPVLRCWLKGAGMIRVDRQSGGASAFREALKALQRGEAVGIFPHGRLVREYEQAVPKDGAVQLAVRAGVPIIPVYCEGTEKALGSKQVIPRLGGQIGLAYGAPYHVPLEKADLKDEQKVKDATWELMRRIVALKGIAKNLTAPATYQPIAPFANVYREADRRPQIWEDQSRVR